MYRDLGCDDTTIFNNFHKLAPAAQRELTDYMNYLLGRQYKREVIITVFHNRLLNNLLHGLLRLIEDEELDMHQIRRRVLQIKELYYALFEKIHSAYAELIEDLDACELVKGFGQSGFANLLRAVESSKPNCVRTEVIDFYQGFEALSRHRRARKIVAV